MQWTCRYARCASRGQEGRRYQLRPRPALPRQAKVHPPAGLRCVFCATPAGQRGALGKSTTEGSMPRRPEPMPPSAQPSGRPAATDAPRPERTQARLQNGSDRLPPQGNDLRRHQSPCQGTAPVPRGCRPRESGTPKAEDSGGPAAGVRQAPWRPDPALTAK